MEPLNHKRQARSVLLHRQPAMFQRVCFTMSVGISGTPDYGTPYPYYSHTTRIRILKGTGYCVGRVWKAYHKGVPLLGVPGITLDYANCELENSKTTIQLGHFYDVICCTAHKALRISLTKLEDNN